MIFHRDSERVILALDGRIQDWIWVLTIEQAARKMILV